METRVPAERVEMALRQYDRCMLCEHRCGVVRTPTSDGGGRCHAGSEARVFRHRVECGEESFLNPCHLFYLSGCDLRCVYCINELNAFDATRGRRLTAAFLREALAAGKLRGARTMQWVGGEPTVHLPAILEAMAGVEALPPVVWKSDFHFSGEALGLLDGVVDVFVADFKFGNDACARRLSGIDRYMEVVTRNLLQSRQMGRLVVRHLLLPGHETCCWQPIAAWMAKWMPQVELSLRGGYLPRWRADRFKELAAPLAREALPRAQGMARQLALTVIE